MILDTKYVLAVVVFAPLGLVNGQESTTIATTTDNNNLIDDVPYQVSLHYSYNDEFICGGSIISPKLVLTAAHCMYYTWGGLLPPLIVTVNAGMKNLNESALKVFTVANITLHPSYNQSTLVNNLAVVEIANEFPTNDAMGSVSLEKTVGPDELHNRCIISGWNQNSYDLKVTEVLISSCATLPNHICTSRKDNNDITCINGAGNPLICDDKLLGVLSVEPDCNDPNHVTIFENVRNSITWLNEFDLTAAASSAKSAVFSYVSLLLVTLALQV